MANKIQNTITKEMAIKRLAKGLPVYCNLTNGKRRRVIRITKVACDTLSGPGDCGGVYLLNLVESFDIG